MNRLTPPKDAVTYKTSDGLEFWMDYQHAEEPYKAPTIRTADPEVRIIFVPIPMHVNQAYLMQYHGTSIVFSHPNDASRLHNDVLERLSEANPGTDLVITNIGHHTQWTATFFDLEAETCEDRTFDIPSDDYFKSFEEQEKMTLLFRELMAWAVDGAISMARGKRANPNFEFKQQTVDFDYRLKKRLAAGGYIA